jgi:hypothetical protein
MASEIQFPFGLTGKTVYAIIRNSTAQAWNTNTNAFEAYNSGNLSKYAISLVEQGTSSGFYAGTFPSAIVAGVYAIVARQQIGGSQAETDPYVGSESEFQWNGTYNVPLSDLATSGQVGNFAPIRIARGVMLPNFMFKLVSSVDHVTPLTSGVVSGSISRDGGFFGPLQSGIMSEVGRGWYSTTFTSGDLLANTAAVIFTATGVSGGNSDPRDFGLILQRVSGQ